MKWDPSLECGVEHVDNEHKELFKMVSHLMQGSKKDNFKEETDKALDFLGKYVVKHFANEEKLMKEVNYPNTLEHTEIHAKFVITFQNLRKKFDDSNGSITVATEIKYAAMSWLVNHIKVIDQRLTDYVKANKQNK